MKDKQGKKEQRDTLEDQTSRRKRREWDDTEDFFKKYSGLKPFVESEDHSPIEAIFPDKEQSSESPSPVEGALKPLFDSMKRTVDLTQKPTTEIGSATFSETTVAENVESSGITAVAPPRSTSSEKRSADYESAALRRFSHNQEIQDTFLEDDTVEISPAASMAGASEVPYLPAAGEMGRHKRMDPVAGTDVVVVSESELEDSLTRFFSVKDADRQNISVASVRGEPKWRGGAGGALKAVGEERPLSITMMPSIGAETGPSFRAVEVDVPGDGGGLTSTLPDLSELLNPEVLEKHLDHHLEKSVASERPIPNEYVSEERTIELMDDSDVRIYSPLQEKDPDVADEGESGEVRLAGSEKAEVLPIASGGKSAVVRPERPEKRPKPVQQPEVGGPAADDVVGESPKSPMFSDTMYFHSDFVPPEGFEEFFSPSDDFVRDVDDFADEPSAQQLEDGKGESVVRRARRRARLRETGNVAMPVQEAVRRLRPYLRSLFWRTIGTLVLSAPLLYLSISQMLNWPLPSFLDYMANPVLCFSVMLLLQMLMMVCSLDIVMRGLQDLAHFRPGLESAGVIACLANMAYIISLLIQPDSMVHPPYGVMSALMLLFMMIGSLIRHISYQRTYTAAAQVHTPVVYVREEALWDGQAAFFKTRGNLGRFVEATEAPDGVRKFDAFLVPLSLVVAVLFALIASVGQERPDRFWWAFSAMTTLAMPLCATLSFTLPFSRATQRLSREGVAMAGWTGAVSFAAADVAVLNDEDIFPPGTATLGGLKVFGNHSFNRVIHITASMMNASGSGLKTVFMELLTDQTEPLCQIENFQHYEGGGMGADIGDDRVLIGTPTFMLRMGIRLPQGLRVSNAIFVVINLELVGVFAVSYQPDERVRRGLAAMIRNDVLPVFAVRNVSITSTMLKKKFQLDADLAELPPIEERLALSEPQRRIRGKCIAASRGSGFMPFVLSILTGRKVVRTTRFNLLFQGLCSAIGLLFMCYLVMQGDPATASPVNIMGYQLAWVLPTAITSFLFSRH